MHCHHHAEQSCPIAIKAQEHQHCRIVCVQCWGHPHISEQLNHAHGLYLGPSTLDVYLASLQYLVSILSSWPPSQVLECPLALQPLLDSCYACAASQEIERIEVSRLQLNEVREGPFLDRMYSTILERDHGLGGFLERVRQSIRREVSGQNLELDAGLLQSIRLHDELIVLINCHRRKLLDEHAQIIWSGLLDPLQLGSRQRRVKTEDSYAGSNFQQSSTCKKVIMLNRHKNKAKLEHEINPRSAMVKERLPTSASSYLFETPKAAHSIQSLAQGHRLLSTGNNDSADGLRYSADKQADKTTQVAKLTVSELFLDAPGANGRRGVSGLLKQVTRTGEDLLQVKQGLNKEIDIMGNKIKQLSCMKKTLNQFDCNASAHVFNQIQFSHSKLSIQSRVLTYQCSNSPQSRLILGFTPQYQITLSPASIEKNNNLKKSLIYSLCEQLTDEDHFSQMKSRFENLCMGIEDRDTKLKCLLEEVTHKEATIERLKIEVQQLESTLKEIVRKQQQSIQEYELMLKHSHRSINDQLGVTQAAIKMQDQQIKIKQNKLCSQQAALENAKINQLQIQHLQNKLKQLRHQKQQEAFKLIECIQHKNNQLEALRKQIKESQHKHFLESQFNSSLIQKLQLRVQELVAKNTAFTQQIQQKSKKVSQMEQKCKDLQCKANEGHAKSELLTQISSLNLQLKQKENQLLSLQSSRKTQSKQLESKINSLEAKCVQLANTSNFDEEMMEQLINLEAELKGKQIKLHKLAAVCSELLAHVDQPTRLKYKIYAC